jgi:hypothetical protein
VVGLIMDALLNSDLNALLSAIDDAHRMRYALCTHSHTHTHKHTHTPTQVVGLIMDALLNSDLNALLSAIDDAHRMDPPLAHPKLDEAMRMKDILEEERQLRLALREVIERRDIPAMNELLARAQVSLRRV